MSKSAARFAQYRAEKAAGVFGAMFAGGNRWAGRRRKPKKGQGKLQIIAPEFDQQAQLLYRKPYSQLPRKHKKKVWDCVGMLRRAAKRLPKRSAARPSPSTPKALPPATTSTRPSSRQDPPPPTPQPSVGPATKEPLIQLQQGKSTALTYNELVFRVLLQREEARPKLTFSALELSLPKPIRKLIEPDWRAYIREENLEFDWAYQKAVRKHLPGVYHVVMAAEFFGKLPFHVALGYFLQPTGFPWERVGISEDDTFALAERLSDEVRRRCAEITQQPQVRQVAPTIPPKPTDPTRRCAFCKQRIPAAEIMQHVDREHINPPRPSGGKIHAITTLPRPTVHAKAKIESVAVRSPATIPATQSLTTNSPTGFDRFRGHRCIGCGNVPIPGDFYCYYCAPK